MLLVFAATGVACEEEDTGPYLFSCDTHCTDGSGFVFVDGDVYIEEASSYDDAEQRCLARYGACTNPAYTRECYCGGDE